MTRRQLHRVTLPWPNHGRGSGWSPAWSPDVPCHSNPDLWFSDKPADVEAAKTACLNACPLKDFTTCKNYASDNNIDWGVWGGQAREERVEKECRLCGDVKLLKEFRPRRESPDGYGSVCRQCGTPAAITVANAKRTETLNQRLRDYRTLWLDRQVPRAEVMRILGIPSVRTALRYETAILNEQRDEVAS